MTWARLKLVDSNGKPVTGNRGVKQAERVFNLALVQWWAGHGPYCELQYAGQAPVYVAIEDRRLEMLTGTSGGYSSD